MKTLPRILSALALVLPLGLSSFGCEAEEDEFEAEFDLRPAQSACPPCFIGDGKVHLGISTDYNPNSILGVSVEISNSGATELLDYGATLAVPNDPSTVEVTDNELCTVGRTGQPPTTAYVEFKLSGAAGPITVGENIAIVSNCP
jgi:hypothetical protein